MPNPEFGAPSSMEAEDVLAVVCQAAATADGNGTVADLRGYAGQVQLELNNTGSGTTNANVEGSFDQSTWYSVGYAQMDGQTNLTRTAGAIAVAGNAAHTFTLLDTYSFLRIRLSGTSGSLTLTATLRAYPV
ncbi:MAG TPA: hypothetical protein VKX16_10335 [Chloroflexota bacterium]|nr:hypothetical protein [Chloroflexota bacterium]